MYKTLILSAVLWVGFISHSVAETWKITSLNWEPYSGESLPDQGTAIKRLRDQLAKQGITLEVSFYPWQRAQKLAEKGDYVGFFPAWPEEVPDGFIASPAIDMSELAVLTHGDSNVSFESVQDLFSNYRVGTIKTYVYPDDISQAMQQHPKNVDQAPHEVALLKKLAAGRTVAAITDPNVMQYLATQEGITDVRVATVLTEKALVLAISDRPENKGKMDVIKQFSTP